VKRRSLELTDKGMHYMEALSQARDEWNNPRLRPVQHAELRMPYAGQMNSALSAPVRCHLGYVGTFEHPVAGRFRLTVSTFEQMVANLSRFSPVKPMLDMDHQSTKLGEGATILCCGFVDSLEIQEDKLYGYLSFTDEGIQATKKNGYRHLSMTIVEGNDRNTGASTGAMLHSVALTRQPFLTGLEPLWLSELKMPHFTRIRTPGSWAPNTVLTDVEMEKIDAQLTAAINGDGGGSWAPSAQITLSGTNGLHSLVLKGGGTAGSPGWTASPTEIAHDIFTTFNEDAEFTQQVVIEDAEINGALEINGSSSNVGNFTNYNAITNQGTITNTGSGIISTQGNKLELTGTFSYPQRNPAAATISRASSIE
jgi:hypothetical protein